MQVRIAAFVLFSGCAVSLVGHEALDREYSLECGEEAVLETHGNRLACYGPIRLAPADTHTSEQFDCSVNHFVRFNEPAWRIRATGAGRGIVQFVDEFGGAQGGLVTVKTNCAVKRGFVYEDNHFAGIRLEHIAMPHASNAGCVFKLLDVVGSVLDDDGTAKPLDAGINTINVGPQSARTVCTDNLCTPSSVVQLICP